MIDDASAEPEQPERPDPLDDETLRAIVEAEINQAINGDDSEIALNQERALRFYRGDLLGNEVKGSSQVVLRDVRETIDWAMPALMRAVFYTQEIVRYEDATPQSEEQGNGRRMTQVINELFRQQLRGVRLGHDWAKAGLLEKFATVKFWIDLVREPSIQSEAQISDLRVIELENDPDVELFEATPIALPAIDPQTGLQVQVYDVRYKRWRRFHRMRLENVPPEEFLISRRAKRLDQDVDFVAHRKRMTKSDIHALGIDWATVAALPHEASSVASDGRAIERESGQGRQFGDSARADSASQEVRVTESYIRVDYDGDGYSEMRRVLTAGEGAQHLLDHDYAPMHGFAGWAPMPMPHQLYGDGYYDVVSDLQEIRTTLARQLLDNIYRMNNARHAVVIEDVDLDSYVDTAPGAPVFVERPDAIVPLPTPALPPWSFEALDYFERVREKRTGIHPYGQEALAAGQNQTAQGVSQVFEAAMAQIQLLCQMFACGLEDLFRIIPRAMKAAGMGAGQIKVGDEWIEYDPRLWPDDYRVTVQVGLSPGQTEQRIQRLMMLLGLQEKALALGGPGYMVTPEQFFATAVRIVEQCGFQSPQSFFTSPAGKEIPAQQPSPEQISAESEAQSKQAQRALDLAKLQAEREQKAQMEARLVAEAQEKYAVERERIAMEERTRRYETDRQFEAAMAQAQARKSAPRAEAQ